LRGDGEVRLLQQAMNFQEAHNDNLKTTAFADSVWVMFDYNRGYADDLESSGVMDIFRLPKFSYWFFRSQRDANELIAGSPFGPMVFIANYWTPDSPLDVRVFSNCEEVARISTNLKHSPFTFKLDQFQPGTLRAIGYVGGRKATSYERHTPGEISRLTLQFDQSDRAFAASGKDTVFFYASLQDKSGNLVPDTKAPVFFGATSQARLVGSNPIMSEAGMATILVESEGVKPACTGFAICLIREQNQTRILSATASPSGARSPDYKIHYTTDGTEPSAASPVYSRPLKNVPQLRAAILVQGKTVASADSRSNAASTRGRIASTAKAATR
jgi:hypothetical protein